MTRKVTASVERYLEGIYRLQEKSGVARTSELVKLLSVVPGTITNTMKRLKREGLVTRRPYRGVKLTEEGRKIALYAIRKHRLLERLLTDILHVEQTLAYEVAFNIGYYIPDSVIEKIEEALETRVREEHESFQAFTVCSLPEYPREGGSQKRRGVKRVEQKQSKLYRRLKSTVGKMVEVELTTIR